MRFWLRWVLGVAVMSGVSLPAWGLRCHNQLIAVGDTQARVLRLCGQPVHRQGGVASGIRKRGRTRDPKASRRATLRWIYHQGQGGFWYIVTFQQHRVQSIQTKRHR